MSSIKLTHIYNPSYDELGQTCFEFLARLGGPSVIHLDGQEPDRCRVILTLLHGNEPSGLKATHQFIREQIRPKTTVKIIIASVVAARTEPVFTHRMLPGQRDLNRCFSTAEKDLQSVLASAISEFINSVRPEAIVDVHNTSGSGPAFCVGVARSNQHRALASHFTHRLIHTDIRLGSVMELDFGCPIVTVEAGGAQDDEADVTAYKGLLSFVCSDNVFQTKQQVEILDTPRRLELVPDVDVSFGEQRLNGSSITIRQDIEKFNFGVTPANQRIGWINGDINRSLQLDSQSSSVGDYFYVENEQILTKQPLKLFMVTTRADIARSDCLFYFVVS